VHGDLWGGNASVFADGRGALIDPACWWADREVDLAMTRLFGGFSARFYEGYQQEWPLDANYQNRIDVYNFYHLLNHANLFGGSYKKQCLTTINAMRSMLL
jgi:fructosamine-3-kinase